MTVTHWITIAIGLVTLANGWAQLWFKECVLTKRQSSAALNFFKGRFGISLMCLSGIISAVSPWMLFREAFSPEPVTRLACLLIASLVVLSVLNLVLIHSLYVLRRLAEMQDGITAATDAATAAQMGIFSRR